MKTPRSAPVSEKARKAREWRAHYRRHFVQTYSRAPSRDRFLIVGFLAAIVAVLPYWLLDKAVQHWWRPRDPGVLLWWVAPGPYADLMLGGGLLLALILGLIAWGGKAPLPRWPLAALLVAWLPAIPLTPQVYTFVYADRIVTSGEDGGPPVTLPFNQASGIEAGCGWLRRGRGEKHIPTVDYWVSFGDQGAVDLGQGVRARSATAVGDWLRIVSGLDRSLTARGVPRHIMVDEDGYPRIRPGCLQSLKAAQDEAGFRSTRQLLAIRDEDLYRNGLAPRGVW